ncbi:hypothetical protein GGR56DRAFT_196543 [Xylariaceae sp. FL0804]|nr:hypothetical protein GGR56DRAFT_196543 [Xylariaceae sp. FL0804]
MPRSSSIVQLAERLLAYAEEIDTYDRLPEPAGPIVALENSRTAVLELSQELQVRVQSPSKFLEKCQIQVCFYLPGVTQLLANLMSNAFLSTRRSPASDGCFSLTYLPLFLLSLLSPGVLTTVVAGNFTREMSWACARRNCVRKAHIWGLLGRDFGILHGQHPRRDHTLPTMASASLEPPYSQYKSSLKII